MLPDAEITPFGFDWGSAKVERWFKHKDSVTVGIRTPKDEIQIYITKTGKVRVWNKKGEMKNCRRNNAALHRL